MTGAVGTTRNVRLPSNVGMTGRGLDKLGQEEAVSEEILALGKLKV